MYRHVERSETSHSKGGFLTTFEMTMYRLSLKSNQNKRGPVVRSSVISLS